jgi:hypothetical protein
MIDTHYPHPDLLRCKREGVMVGAEYINTLCCQSITKKSVKQTAARNIKAAVLRQRSTGLFFAGYIKREMLVVDFFESAILF